MSEKLDPAAVAREAKSIHQSLKELLKTKEPFDKEVDFQRKNLRRCYLILLLVHPSAKESKDVENHLWMQTSYASIASFKQRIALDRTGQNNQRQQTSGPTPGQNPHHGVVEHRKFVQRFKQFLADEERFWKQLILRLFRLFDLQEARAALISLGLLGEADEDETSPGVDGIDGNGRNHYQFPPRDPSVDFTPKATEEREARISTLSKALICFGDIARYREQYNEGNGRPRVGQDDNVPARRGRRRGGAPESVARARNYDKAQQCYEQARLLVPHEGNPSHQLAILASYQKDSFSSIIHYYRSLCVRQPYDTASENLGTVLTKSLDLWRQKKTKEKDKGGTNEAELPINIRVDLFRERIVVLHALWRVGVEKGIEKMRSISPKHHERVGQDYYSLVSDRNLSIDMILNTIVLAQGALWKHRMIRDPTLHRSRNESSSDLPNSAILIEWSILDHLLDLHRILLDVGRKELADPPEETDLALKISATFRRTLPALRIASKWLCANMKYLGQDQEFVAFQAKEKTNNSTVVKRDANKISGYSAKTIKFWNSYASFMLALSRAFPSQKLPPFDAPLEEDIEMRGFLPLRNLIGEKHKNGDKTPAAEVSSAREQVHPNVEQLMRLSDLIEDAKTLLDLENPPIRLFNNHFVFNSEIVEDISASFATSSQQGVDETTINQQQTVPANTKDTSLDLYPEHHQETDDLNDFTSRVDDDPVRDAFQFLNTASDGVEDEDEDDEIVYMRYVVPLGPTPEYYEPPPRSSVSPTLSPKAHQDPTTPIRAVHSPENRSPQSPTGYGSKLSPVTMPPPVSSVTAQDLLNDVMGMGGSNSKRRGIGSIFQQAQGSSAPQPKFLFGSELSRGASQSIWSTARDEQPLIYPGNGATSVGFNNPHTGMNGSHNFVGMATLSNSLHLGGNVPTAVPGGQIYQTSSHLFPVSGDSHDPPSHQSIWSTSYGAPPTSPQRTVPFSTSTFPQPSQTTMSTVVPQSPLSQHRREQSISGASYPHQQYPNLVQQDPFMYSSPVLQQPALHYLDPQLSAHFNTSVGQGGLPPFAQDPATTSISSDVGQTFFNPGYHSRQFSNESTRAEMGQLFASPTVSQTWDNGG